MALLSGLFGSSDSESEDSNSSDLLGIIDLDSALDFNTTSYSQSTDEDGNSDTSFDSTSLNSDLDFGSLISNVTDSFSSSSSDSDSGGGLFG